MIQYCFFLNQGYERPESRFWEEEMLTIERSLRTGFHSDRRCILTTQLVTKYSNLQKSEHITLFLSMSLKQRILRSLQSKDITFELLCASVHRLSLQSRWTVNYCIQDWSSMARQIWLKFEIVVLIINAVDRSIISANRNGSSKSIKFSV
jgi:hypothetical protein